MKYVTGRYLAQPAVLTLPVRAVLTAGAASLLSRFRDRNGLLFVRFSR